MPLNMNEEKQIRKNMGAAAFLSVWPVRKRGENEDYLWCEIDNLLCLKENDPDMAENLLIEETGVYLLVRGIIMIETGLYEKGLYLEIKGKKRLLRDDESRETAEYIKEQEEKLIKELKATGIRFGNEKLVWDFMKILNTLFEDEALSWGLLCRFWKELSGKGLSPDVTDRYICRHISALFEEEDYEKEWGTGIIYALKQAGCFKNVNDRMFYRYADLEKVHKALIKNKNENVLRLLLERGFFSEKMLKQLVEQAADSWNEAVPLLIMAKYGRVKEME